MLVHKRQAETIAVDGVKRTRTSFDDIHVADSELHEPASFTDPSSLPSEICRVEFRKNNFDYLPLELLDDILTRALLLGMVGKERLNNDRQVILTLASVDKWWSKRITGKRFKKTIWRHLTAYYEKKRKQSSQYLSILQANLKYLEQTIQHDESPESHKLSYLIQMLSAFKVLKKQEVTIIMRQYLEKDKTRELLLLAKSFDDIQFTIFTECLRKTRLLHVLQLFEEGGVAVKVIVLNKNNFGENVRVKEKELIEKLRELMDETIPRNDDLEKLLIILTNNQMKIIHAVHKCRIVLWIWCQSKGALKKLWRMTESSELLSLLSKLFKHLLPDGDIVPKTVIVHKEQFRKAVVNLRTEVKLMKTINFREERKCIKGVVKLHNNIYVLCQTRPNLYALNSICIYEGQNQFHLLKQIGLRDIVHPWDIAASPVGNCLYITDCATNSVWQIRPEDKFRMTKWKDEVTSPWTLSVHSSNGQILIARCKSLSVLEIYEINGLLYSVTALPVDIHNPRHAVQNSEGNFVVLHWKKEEKMGSTVWISSISEVSGGGNLLRCMYQGEIIRQLDNSSHIFIDSADRVFVADSGKNRVIMLDSKLNWNRLLLASAHEELENEQDAIRWPVRLFYDEKSKQLGVAGDVFGVNIYAEELTSNSTRINFDGA